MYHTDVLATYAESFGNLALKHLAFEGTNFEDIGLRQLSTCRPLSTEVRTVDNLIRVVLLWSLPREMLRADASKMAIAA